MTDRKLFNAKYYAKLKADPERWKRIRDRHNSIRKAAYHKKKLANSRTRP